MTKIYEQHDAAFKRISAYAITDENGRMVARFAIKFPRYGTSRLYAYVQVLGEEMVRDYAGGGGYDKTSAAVEGALRKISEPRLKAAAREMANQNWTRALEKAGFNVLHII